MNRIYDKLDISSEDFSKFRDEDGYINIDIKSFSKESRERMGNDKRIKNWIETANGKKYIIKSNAKIDNQENYLEYAELICEEIAKQIGFPYASYDLVKINGEKGIITECIVQKNEYMVSLEDFIWSTLENPEPTNKGIIDYIDTIKQLSRKLKEANYDIEQSRKLINDLKKLMIFDTIVGATDRHAENVSLILNENDKKSIKLAPIYDTENSLLLENTVEMVQDMAFNPNYCKEAALSIMPKMAIVPNADAQVEDITHATFEFSIMSNDDNFELEDFAADSIDMLDIAKVLKNVENKIHSVLPVEISRVVTSCITYRRKDLSKILDGSIEVDYDNEYLNNIQEKLNNIRKQ